MTLAEVSFDNEDHVLTVLNRVLEPLGEHIDAAHPIVKARFPDGTGLHAVTRPIAQFGTTITIRKYSKFMPTIEDLIRFGSLSAEVAEFLRACVIARLNIIVSGDSGSGKTALLNVLSNFIPNDERIVTIETIPELQLRQKHVISLISRPPDTQERGEITIRELIKNSLQMRPDRIVVGDCRSGEVIDLLQAMYTGYDGALTSVRSNDAHDALRRLEVMCLMSGTEFPLHAIREMIASAINLIVHQERLRDGTRKIVKITEVHGIEGDVFTLSDIYEFEQTGIEAGKIKGRLRPTGVRPNFLKQIESWGIHLPTSIFEIGSNPPVDS